MLPTVFELNEEYSSVIFQDKKNTFFLYRDEKNSDSKALEEAFKKVASELKGQVVFTISGITDPQ